MADTIIEEVVGLICIGLAIWDKQASLFIRALCLLGGIVIVTFGLADLIS